MAHDGGFIFLVDSKTEQECLARGLGALPGSSRALAEGVARGALIFVYNTSFRLLHGVFEARERGGLNLEPEAFGGRFAAQVRFRERWRCPSLPLAEVSHLLHFTSAGKFQLRLSPRQAQALCDAFYAAARGSQRPADAAPRQRSNVRVTLSRGDKDDELPRRRVQMDGGDARAPTKRAASPPTSSAAAAAAAAPPPPPPPAKALRADDGAAVTLQRCPLRVRLVRTAEPLPPESFVEPAALLPQPPPQPQLPSPSLAAEEYMPLPADSPPGSPSALPPQPLPPEASQQLSRSLIGGDIRPLALLGCQVAFPASVAPPAVDAGDYRAMMLREALPPLQEEIAAIRALPADGDARGRATRRLLARFHPSQSAASVANPALQWLFTELTKEITAALS